MSAAGTPGDVLVGVDVGTTRVKVLALTPEGREVGSAERPTPWRHAGPATDMSPVQLAETVTQACLEAASVALAGAGGSAGGRGRVAAIGFTGMAETGVLTDAAGRPCAPALAWYDTRADLDAIRGVCDPPTFRAATGLGLTALPSLGKVLWLHRAVPGARAAVRHLSVGEWLVRRLGGDEVAELSLLSRTGMWEVAANRPWAPAEELLGRSLLPATVVVAGTPAGRVGDEAPELLRGAVLTVAGHDHQAAAFAVGAARPGILFDSLGTAEALLRHVPAPPDTPQLRAGIEALAAQGVSVGHGVVPGSLCVLAGLLTGLTLERVCALVGAVSREARYALGAAALDLAAAPADGAAPDGTAPGLPLRILGSDGDGVTIGGVTEEASPAALFAAALGRLTRECDDLLGAIEGFAGPRESAVAAGGWLNNPAVTAVKQRQHGRVTVSGLTEAGATGAAVLAGIAAGMLPHPAPGEEPRWADGSPTSQRRPASPGGRHPEPLTSRRTHG